ncbi:endonuclease MutS2 [Dulcicalothrix desertica PCC 7102]|uniref:Endonuclease MutS2 n=1 Tax=Dulcicalothrix desertica PCC 7102 TaxID=232991 RepID=A0A3S1IEM3_9CYAN|nr:endonuclease MutS2 [Dulcicalothrix desertica]RUS96269.1 endonuclease MutS2 [Dulcicalothrix desertica PCC 7102]TWH40406.1 DNA mismatch repair protein MutS2 [Dulcicalothrix desertica PCC 7102]
MIQSETLELLEWSRLCQHLSTFAATKLGAVASRHLTIPTSKNLSEELLAQTKEVYELESRLNSGLSFEGIQDIGDSLERAQIQGILAGDELLAIATTLSGARNLRRAIDNHEDLVVLTSLVSELRTYPEVEQEIHRCVDERGQIADRASQKLGDIRADLRKTRSQITQKLHNIIQVKSSALQENIITQRGDRFVIPVKATHKDAIPGIVHDTSTSGLTLYVEPNSVVPMGNQLRQLTRKEEIEEEAIRRQLSEQVGAICPDLERLLLIVTTLDLATAKARYGYWLKANPPRFIDIKANEKITLRQLRHPLLEWQHHHEQGHAVIPVDLLVQPETRVVTITGPNTGGKTVTLKTLALAALMAKAGMFVPAREPVELPWFDMILADIGDEQSLQQSLSTFSGHIRRISRILNELGRDVINHVSTSSSLILLDEVGAGTDPAEGSALAIALLKYLADYALLTMASTHFGELKALKYQDERFENASVEFDDATLSPTYRLLWGIPGRSNALAIARRLGLNPEVVEAAKQEMGGANDEVNSVIAGLEAQRRRQETKAAEAQKLLQQAEVLYKQVSEKATSLEEREQSLKEKQEVAVQQAIASAKGEIATVIRRLQKGTPTAQEAQFATNNLNQIAEKFTTPQQQKPKVGFMPKVGDRIRISKLGQTAEVITAPDSDGELNVRFGIMKMNVKLTDIESLDGQKVEPPPVKQTRNTPSNNVTPPPEAPNIRTSKNTFDIRGKRVADAEIILDKAISEASGPIWIIHGHGTGKLREGVHAYLKQHSRVKRMEPAAQADGGTGVTIAYV